LLKITSVPISLEYKVRRARLVYSSERPTANVSRQKGRAYIQTTPARVTLDTYETRASAGLKSAPRSVQEFAEAGREAAMEASRGYAEEGNAILDSHGKGNPVLDSIASKSMRTADTIMAFIPSVPVDISVEPGSISFDYSMDKLNYDWNINPRAQLEYEPGGIEYTVAQYPDVIIEYVGSPIYVPPSADPDYVPPPSLDSNA
jgi:hypothetical protein